MTGPQNSTVITGSKTMQMVADDQGGVNRIQMTAVQQSELWITSGQRPNNGHLWDHTWLLLLLLLLLQTFHLCKVIEVIC